MDHSKPKLVKGIYNTTHGIEMSVDSGIYEVQVFKYPEFSPDKALVNIKCTDYAQASMTFNNIEDNLLNLEKGKELDTLRFEFFKKAHL